GELAPEGAPAPFAPVASDTVPGLLLTCTGDDQGVFGAGDFDVVAAHPGEVAANQQIVLPHEDIGGRAPGLRSGTRPCQFVAGRRIGDRSEERRVGEEWRGWRGRDDGD